MVLIMITFTLHLGANDIRLELYQDITEYCQCSNNRHEFSERMVKKNSVIT